MYTGIVKTWTLPEDVLNNWEWGHFRLTKKFQERNPHVSRKLPVVPLPCVRMELWQVPGDLLSVKCEIKVTLKF